MKYICWGPGAAAQTAKLLRRKREKKIEPVGAQVVLRAQLMCVSELYKKNSIKK